MNVRNLNKLARVAQPVVIGVSVMVGVLISVAQIRERKRQRARWMAPVLIIGGLIVIGLFAAVVQRVVATVPTLACANGSYLNASGVQTCQAIYSSETPAGATARCSDGTYSFNHDESSTCSQHGGAQLRYNESSDKHN